MFFDGFLAEAPLNCTVCKLEKSLKNFVLANLLLLTMCGHKVIINMCPRIRREVLNIETRKKPGPHTDSPKDTTIKLRADKDTIEEIKYCKEKLNTTLSEVLRKGVHMLYEDLKKK